MRFGQIVVLTTTIEGSHTNGLYRHETEAILEREYNRKYISYLAGHVIVDSDVKCLD